jgi:hypothetical protein
MQDSVIDVKQGAVVAYVLDTLVSKDPLRIQAAPGQKVNIFADGRRGSIPIGGRAFDLEFSRQEVMVYLGSNLQAAGKDPKARINLVPGGAPVARGIHLDRVEPLDVASTSQPVKKRAKKP